MAFSAHLSIRFSFFLHGESTVCASIDVRQHPPLRTLHQQHLTIASQGGGANGVHGKSPQIITEESYLSTYIIIYTSVPNNS